MAERQVRIGARTVLRSLIVVALLVFALVPIGTVGTCSDSADGEATTCDEGPASALMMLMGIHYPTP